MTAINFTHVYYGNTDKYCVSLYQLALLNKGYSIPAGATGFFGDQTKAATQRFQKSQGWSGGGADGLPGPQTFARLGLSHTDNAGAGPAPVPVTPAPTNGKISTGQIDFAGKGAYASGESSCRAYIQQACQIMGLDPTFWVPGGLTIASRETAYNASQWQINTTDSNAKNVSGLFGGGNAPDGYKGQCSRGMMQCIPQTFAAYHAAGTSLRIYDPVASAGAAFNYIMDVYGVSRSGSNLTAKVQQADPNRPARGY